MKKIIMKVFLFVFSILILIANFTFMSSAAELPGFESTDTITAAFSNRLYYPLAIAADALGNIYVLNQNHSVTIFDSAGIFLDTWELSTTMDARELFIDSTGDLYTIPDISNIPIKKYDSSGILLKTFTTLTNAKDLIVDISNNLYILTDNTVMKYDSNENLLTQWGSEGISDGQFNDPSSIAIDSSGNIYIADTDNDRIQKFDSAGNFLSKFGVSGTGEGQLNHPTDISLDDLNNIYIVDNNKTEGSREGRVQKYDSSGTFINKITDYGHHTATAPNNILYVLIEDWLGVVNKYDSTGSFISSNYGNVPDGSFCYPGKFAIDKAGNIFIIDTLNYRIQKLSASGVYQAKWGPLNPETWISPFSPDIIRIDSQGNILALDSTYDSNLVIKLDNQLNYLSEYVLADKPVDIVLDSLDNTYMRDTTGNIKKYDKDWNLLTQWSLLDLNQSNGEIDYSDMAIDGADNISVRMSSTVKTFSNNGTLIREWEVQKSFYGYGELIVDNDGNYYILQYTLNKYDPTGNLVINTGISTSLPQPVAVDSNNNIYIYSGNLSWIRYSPLKYYIKGTVKDQDGICLSGVSVALTGSKTAVSTTNNFGTYVFGELFVGNYTVAISKDGYNFSAKTYSPLSSSMHDQDFSGELVYSIKGYIENVKGEKLSGVTVSLSGDTTGTYTTTDSGYYEFNNLYDGHYNITATKGGYSFSPDHLAYTTLTADQVNQNFSAVPGEVAVSDVVIFGGEHGYVNPAKGEKFYLTLKTDSGGQVTIKIYDLMGTQVKEIIKDISGSGTEIITWNGRNDHNQSLSSGVYLVHIEGCGIKKITKVAVIK